MKTRSRAVSVSVALLLFAAATAVAPGAVASSGAAANEVAARSDARSLLARLRLPTGATRSAVEPVGDAGALAHHAVGLLATPSEVDVVAFWTLRASPHAVLAFVKASPPAGSKLWVSGSGSGPGSPGYSYEGFQWPAITNVIETRQLIVEVSSLNDGMTGVRADAQVVAITPRGNSERIPAGTTRLSVTSSSSGGHQIPIATVTSPAKIRKVIALLDGLSLLPPEHPFECGPSAPEPVRLAFYSQRGGAPLATASFESFPTTSGRGWCSTVGMTINGRAEQPRLLALWWPGCGLSPFPPLVTRLDATLNIKIPTATSPT